MYLKSLELQGFKSFPDKTKLTFENGATVIVGPNGSGKSNISDAMRWVLGEISSKSLRGSKMEDVIFGGADSRRPMGYAEVSVTFDNTGEDGGKLDSPYDEVTVTRRYYRAGESEYFINRKPVRLKDIYELFMNTGIGRDGYSIIGQGKIAEIISQKSDERRSIFEDASGIAKYRHRKSEAERKLNATEDNMLRINDILSELEGRVEPLRKESEKAKKYLELYDTKKKADVQLWLYDTEKLRGDITAAESAFKMSELELAGAEDSLAALEAQSDKLFEASQSNKLESEELLVKIREQTDKNHDLDSEYRVGENNIEHTKELIASAEGAISNSESAIAAESAGKQTRAEHISTLELSLAEMQDLHASKTEEQKECSEKAESLEGDIATALDDIRALEGERVDVRVRMSVLQNAKTTDTDKNTSILGEIAEYEKTSAELTKKCAVAKEAVDKYIAEIDKIDAEADKLSEKTVALNARRRAQSEELSSATVKRDTIAQRIDALKRMEEHFEGYNNSVRFVMKQFETGNIKGKVYGPLSKLITVENKYITAIETSLGANLQNIVVEDEETAKAAIGALKNAGAGRATFYPVTSMRASAPSNEVRDASTHRGYIGTADKLVRSDARFGEIIASLLARTVVFDNIDNASSMAKALRYKVRVVTLDGQQINPGGSFTGGSVKRDSGILSRTSEIEKLGEELTKASKDAEGSKKKLEDIDREISNAENEAFSLDDRRKLIQTMMNAENSGYDQLSAKLDANNSLIEKLRADFETLSQMQKRYEEDLAELLVKEKELTGRIDEISEYRTEKEVEKNDILDRKNALGEELTELYISMSEARKDIETEKELLLTSDDRIAVLERDISDARARIEELNITLKAHEKAQRDNRKLAEEGEKLLAELNSGRAEKEAGGFEFEKKLNEIRVKIRDKNNEKDLIFRSHTANENKLAQLTAEQDKLSSRLWDDYELTRAAALELGYPTITNEQRAEVYAVQTECRNKLRSLGSVNVGAIEEYAEVKTRYDYMSGQIKDLNDAKTELTDIINKLEKEMKTAFVDAFNAINENFGKTFSELFGGGSAEILLTDPENVLTSGIEIKAAPPGKIIKSLMQLSGGEQSFVAIALFFAILKVNPTPFCILDEIEAALDEVNVARFGEYIKRYSSGGTQFILITHRRGTMEVADRLYGVTMPEHGISKVLSLNVADIKKTEGDDWDGIFGQA
ncbi:MAG: chromosome segregation protein SMC [Ruminococcaceae bacterium]|nr:chromosome segregation protein SMC [Oscillospiraceae bacterium]